MKPEVMPSATLRQHLVQATLNSGNTLLRQHFVQATV